MTLLVFINQKAERGRGKDRKRNYSGYAVICDRKGIGKKKKNPNC